jgi:hypothetical protein
MNMVGEAVGYEHHVPEIVTPRDRIYCVFYVLPGERECQSANRHGEAFPPSGSGPESWQWGAFFGNHTDAQ